MWRTNAHFAVLVVANDMINLMDVFWQYDWHSNSVFTIVRPIIYGKSCIVGARNHCSRSTLLFSEWFRCSRSAFAVLIMFSLFSKCNRCSRNVTAVLEAQSLFSSRSRCSRAKIVQVHWYWLTCFPCIVIKRRKLGSYRFASVLLSPN